MKAIFEQVTSRAESSIAVMHLSQPQFEAPYHFHPELELTYIKKGYGKRFIGGEVSVYEPGDLVLIGANVPHCWCSEPSSEQDSAQAIVIQFGSNFAGNDFWKLSELSAIEQLIKKANRGILIKGETGRNIVTAMEQCLQCNSLAKLLKVIEMLHIIATSNEIELIGDLPSDFSSSLSETKRFQKVFDYLISHYQQEISLATVAQIANLTPTAFCRYFKGITSKTLTAVLMKFRVNQARQLLRTTEKSVMEVCYQSGFKNISHFNKTFKAATGKTPLAYRREFMQTLKIQ